MNNVERFRAALAGEPVDRLPAVEWAPWWDQTLERWRGEGLPAEVTEDLDIQEFFGLDLCQQIRVSPCGPGCPRPASHGAPIIRDEAEYERVKEHLYPRPCFDAKKLGAWAERHGRGEVALWLTVDGFFWFPRRLLGIEPHLYAFYDQPELMQRMNQDLLEHSLRVLDEICEVVTPEFLTFAEDMSYNHGPMLSKELFDEFLAPHYREIIPAVKAKGVVPILDSDGDITDVVSWYKDVGIEGILPLERMAGVDVAAIRAAHPEFIMIGAFDKTVMHLGEAAVRAEFERLLPTMRSGRLVPSVDHQTPPGVSMQDYKNFVALLGEYCAKAAE